MDAIIWEGSGSPWRGATWGGPVAARLTALGLRVRTVPWGTPGLAHRGRPDVLHVFSGGMEPMRSGSAAMRDRMGAVTAAVLAAAEDACSVVGICLGAQMIAAAVSGLEPIASPGGGEARPPSAASRPTRWTWWWARPTPTRSPAASSPARASSTSGPTT